MLLKIGDKVVKFEDLYDVEVIERGRRIMKGNILAIIRKIEGELEEFEKRAILRR